MNVMKVMNAMKANLVGMARMPYPPTICKDNSELLLKKRNISKSQN